MMETFHYDSIKGRAEEIIEAVMAHPAIQEMPEQEFTFHLVLEELVVNVVNYAYPTDEDGDLTIQLHDSAEEIRIVLIDHGKPFNPLAKEDPDITLGIEERPIGGLGIFLVKQMMDDVEYQYADNSNMLTIVKKKAA